MNVSMAKLGTEECESCEEYKIHSKDHEEKKVHKDCEACLKWNNHIETAEKARNLYREDVLKNNEESTIYYSVDLQKVIMLPRLDMFKKSIFTLRIPIYNESFVPLGNRGENGQKNTVAFLWHDAMMGRSKDEIISTFYQFFKKKSDVKNIILWMDNCTAQNKNWGLLSFLLSVMDFEETTIETITFRFFEPGHTFMAADNFHHQVELSMKKAGDKLYDFSDFVNCVENAAEGVEVKIMELGDFFSWPDFSSQYQLSRMSPRPYLKDMVEIKASRKSRTLSYKTDWNGPSISLDILNKKMKKCIFLPRPIIQDKQKGIEAKRKEDIIKNLGSLMSPEKLEFWQNLPLAA